MERSPTIASRMRASRTRRPRAISFAVEPGCSLRCPWIAALRCSGLSRRALLIARPDSRQVVFGRDRHSQRPSLSDEDGVKPRSHPIPVAIGAHYRRASSLSGRNTPPSDKHPGSKAPRAVLTVRIAVRELDELRIVGFFHSSSNSLWPLFWLGHSVLPLAIWPARRFPRPVVSSHLRLASCTALGFHLACSCRPSESAVQPGQSVSWRHHRPWGYGSARYVCAIRAPRSTRGRRARAQRGTHFVAGTFLFAVRRLGLHFRDQR